MARFIVAIVVLVASTLGSTAQDRVFLQIAARPTLGQALDDLRGFSRDLTGLGGYRMRNGWYALAIGPFARPAGEAELARLQNEGRIPRDSFLASPRDFRRQFWPNGVNALAANAPLAPLQPGGSQNQVTQTTQAAPQEPIVVPDETPREARASERRLDAEERKDLQRALAWFGHYGAAIDGDIGPGSRTAMAKWQDAQGLEQTGVLTTRQRADLMASFKTEMTELGLAPVTDDAAGIIVDMPRGLVSFSRVSAPFVHYEGTGDTPARVVLISQAGDRARLRSLFDVLQTLEIVPGNPSAKFSRDSFTISGENEEFSTQITVSLAPDGIKGFALVWPNGLPGHASRIAQAMQAGFTRIDDRVLAENAGNAADQDVDLLAGLEIRRPDWVRSAIFIDSQGRAISVAHDLDTCKRLTIGDDIPVSAKTIGTTAELALLIPDAGAAPLDFARFATGPGRIGSDVFISGFAYEGRLDAPSLGTGTLADIKGLDGEDGISRLQLSQGHTSFGGPVFDATGAVVGLLQKHREGLPNTARTAHTGTHLVAALDGIGIPAEPALGQEILNAEDLAVLAGDITAKIACWAQ